MSNQYLILATAALFAAAPLAAQGTASLFDGRWTIVAVAENHDCGQAYYLPIDVQDSVIRYAGRHAVDANGRIDSAGQVTMSLAYNGDVVNAQGRLGVKTGNGEWDSPGCAGTWRGHKSSSPLSYQMIPDFGLIGDEGRYPKFPSNGKGVERYTQKRWI